MKGFVLHLQDATAYRRVEGVTAFVGRDASGSFGVRAGHEHLLTCLTFGLARYRTNEAAPWTWLALPGGVLQFLNNELFLSTRRWIEDSDYERITQRLRDQIEAEEEAIQGVRSSLRQMEEEMLKRIWQLGRREDGHE